MPDNFFDILRTVFFFKDLSDEDVVDIGRYCHVESYPAGHTLFRERDPADKFYVVKSGRVEIWKNFDTADAILLTINGPGHFFGEMALVDDLDRSATIIAHEDSEFLVIYHYDFESIMRSRPNVSLSILRSLSLMLRNSNDLFIHNLSQQNKQLQNAYQELKAAQDELLREERFSNLGKFASFILHDLRNPIAMIRGYAEMIGLECENDSCNSYSQKIVYEADHVNRFANEILDYSRGEIRLNYVFTTIGHLFDRAETYLKSSFERKGILLQFQSRCQAPVFLDEERMLRVLINIADNARKASSEGSSVVISSAELGRYAQVAVRDEGEGMTDEVKKKVFEPFFSSSHKGGTGLGMVIVKNVVEAHRGIIELESEPGTGTTIRIMLPFQPETY